MADETTIGKLIVQLLLEDDEYDEGIQQAKKKTEQLGVDLSYLADLLNKIVTVAFQAATAAAVGLAAASAVVGATFESEMTKVGVIAGATAEEMAALEDKARDLGATTNFSASEAAGAMNLLAGAGLDTNEVLVATGDALNLAGAGGTKLDTAAAALTSTMSQFGLKAESAGRIADVFAASTAKSQFTVEDLSEAMKYGGTVGAGFKWSLEQTVAALAQFRDMGLVGASAGTALRSAMVGATTASKKNVETLEKYGLTMAEISPETHSFAEILTAVGKAGVSTTDAMVVFGAEAGAVVKSLADKFAAGESNYGEMLATLENSTGTATTMFASMTDTVMGRWQNLQSAVEEFLLTTFDQYSEPLVALLEAMSNVVNRISGEVQERSGEIQDSLATAFGAVTDFLNENADYIADSIAGFAQDAAAFVAQVRLLIPYLEAILPLLDDIALAMGLVWVTTKVMGFVSAVASMIPVFISASASVETFMVTLTAATGGIYALVVGIGMLVAGLVYLTNRYFQAADAADRLKESQDRLKEKSAEEDVKRLNAIEQILDEQQRAARAELAHSETLSDVRRRELEQISELTAAEALRLEQQGKLVEVGGQLRNVGSIVDELDPATMHALDASIASLNTNAKEAKTRIAEWEQGLRNVEAAMEDGRSTTGAYVQTLLSQAGITATSYEDAQAQLEALRGEQARFADQARALETERARAVGDLRTDELRKVERTEQAKLSAGEAALTKAAGKEKEYVDKVAGLHEGLAREVEAIGKTELERHDLDLKYKLDSLQRSYLDQIKAAGANKAEVARLEGQYVTDEEAILAIHAARRTEIVEAGARAESEARTREAERVQGIISNLEEDGLSESQRLEREKAEVLAGIAEEYGAERARIAALYDIQIGDARRKEAEDAADAEESGLEKFSRALRKTGDVASDVMSGIRTAVDSVTGAINTVTGAADSFISFFADGLESLTGFSFDLVDAIEAVVDMMAEASASGGPSIGTGPGGEAISASGTNPVASAEAASNVYVNGLVEAAVAFVRTAVAAVPTLIQALVDGIPVLIEELVAAIPQVVATVAEAIPGLVQMFVAEAPKVIQALVDGLPTLVMALVDAIPTIIQFIIDTLPTIIQPLMDAAQAIMDALIQEIPRLIVAIIEMIPDIIKDVLAHLPDVIEGLIRGVTDIIVAIVAALPEIVTNIIDAIPAIITSLVSAVIDSIPVVVMAIVEAIPGIITGILQGIPDIIRSILASIPDIIRMVVELIPDLIEGVIKGLPDILAAIIELIPELVVAIVESLPEIIIALIEGLVVRLPIAIAQILWEAIESIWDAVVQLFTDLWATITGTEKKTTKKADSEPGLFEKGGAVDKFIDGIFGGGTSGYSGINYIPATMRITAHEGEMLVPKDRNPYARGLGRSDPAMAGGGGPTGGGGGGGGSRVEIAVVANGRDIDHVVVESMARGQATEIKRTMRALSGLRAGLDRGRYVRWNK